MVLPSFLLHDLTYPRAQTWREMLVSKQSKATTGTFLGLNLFPLWVPPEQPHCTFKEHQHLSPLSAIHHEFALRSNSCKNKMESSAAVRNKGFFPCSCWERWSFPVLNSLQVSRRMSKHLAVRRKTEGNQKSLHDLSVIKRLEAWAKCSHGQGWTDLGDRYLSVWNFLAQ